MSNFTINRVVLVGRLTRDPELRALPSGTSVCSLRIACNSSWRDAEGDVHERPNYFDVSVYGGAAESVSRYMQQGQPRRRRRSPGVARVGDRRAAEAPGGEHRRRHRQFLDPRARARARAARRRPMGEEASSPASARGSEEDLVF